MNKNKFAEIEKLISEDKIKDAQLELSKMGPSFLDNPEYIYLRGKVFYINKLYYLAIDTLLIALEIIAKYFLTVEGDLPSSSS